MTIKDVRSIVEHDRDVWKTRASSYRMNVDAGNDDAITRFYDAMSKWEVLSDLLFAIDMYEHEGSEK